MQSYGIAPTAMTADHGYIAAGAQRGMVRLLLMYPKHLCVPSCCCAGRMQAVLCGRRCSGCQGTHVPSVSLLRLHIRLCKRD